jgi:hypothetical protein
MKAKAKDRSDVTNTLSATDQDSLGIFGALSCRIDVAVRKLVKDGLDEIASSYSSA